MKKFKSLYLPALIIMMGVGAAFASNNAKASDSTMESGYLLESGQCIEKRSDCSPTGVQFCTWTDASNQSHNLSRLSGTSCVIPLYEP